MEEGKGEVEKVNRGGPILPSLIMDFPRSKHPLLPYATHLITINHNQRCQSHRSSICKYNKVRAVVSVMTFVLNEFS